MNNLYQILDELRTYILTSDFTNAVTFGDISDVDLKKKTNFPLVHLILNNVTIDENYIDFTVDVIACDIVDVSKEPIPTDSFLGNDNLQDILAVQLKVITDITNFFRRGDHSLVGNIQITDSVTATPFLDRFENVLAGWEASVTLRSAMQDRC